MLFHKRTITTHQIQLVKQTWKPLRDVNPELLGEVFYQKLFYAYPSLRGLFTYPMNNQYTKLVSMINLAVARIDRPEELISTLQQLGISHQQMGVKPEHFPAVGEALLWTLQQGLGRDWREEVAQAWEAFYQWLATIMIHAMTHHNL